MIVNVCPSAVTSASPDRLWEILSTPESYGEWTDARYASHTPPGPVTVGTKIRMTAPGFGRTWLFAIEITGMDPARRWIDMVARFPLGIDNLEHMTLTERPDGGTLIRFN